MTITNLTNDIAIEVTVTYQNQQTAETANLLPGKTWENQSPSVVEVITALMAPKKEATPYMYQKTPCEEFKIVLQKNIFSILPVLPGEAQ